MKILIINRSTWDDRLANGNTLTNLFSQWPDAEFACLYCRDALPQNNCCRKYLSVSPLNVLRNIFTPWNIGKTFELDENKEKQNESLESKLTDKTTKGNRSLFTIANEMIYFLGHWMNKKYKKFINDFDPDIVFCFGVPEPVMYKTLRYVKENTRAVIISYFVDDLYNGRSKNKILKNIEQYRLKKIAEWSDRCYGISQLMCDEYSKIFNKEFSLLFKGCEIRESKKEYGLPIHFVYAGNLLFNRSESLIALANAIKSVNVGDQKAFLDIYSGTNVTEEIRSMLNIEGVCKLNSPKPFAEIKEILHNSDIVLHVESFDKTQIDVVRLSFSTKITDCMQSGSVMMAIGPRGIASIEYPIKSIPGAIVVSSLESLPDIIRNIVENPNQLAVRALSINEFAKNNVEIGQVRTRLMSDFKHLLELNNDLCK